MLDELIHHGLRFAGQASQAEESLIDSRVESANQIWNQLVAQAVAGKAAISVARIFAKVLFQRSEEFPHLPPSEGQHRADEAHARRQSTRSGYSSQAVQSCAAQNAMKHRFDLIIGRMGRRKISCSMSFGDFRQALVSRLPRGGLESLALRMTARFGSQACDFAGHCQTLADVSHKSFVRVGFGTAKPVVYVGCHQVG